MIPTADFDTVLAESSSSSLEERVSVGAVQEQNPAALAQAAARSLIADAYTSFEAQYHSQEFVANYTSLKQEAVASLKQQLKELRDTAQDNDSRKIFDNYYRAAQLQFAQKEKSLERTIAVDYTQPASYHSNEYLCSTVVSDPSIAGVVGAMGALGIGFAMASKRRRKKEVGKSAKNDTFVLTPLPVVDDEIIAGEEDDDSDDAAVASKLDISLARTIIPSDAVSNTVIHENILSEPDILEVRVIADQGRTSALRVSETYLSASKAASDFTDSPTNPGVAFVRDSPEKNPSATPVIVRGDTASTGYTSENMAPLDAGVMIDENPQEISAYFRALGQSSPVALVPRKTSLFSKVALVAGGIAIGVASAVTLSVSAATYFAHHVSSPENTPQAAYPSQQAASLSPQPTYSNPVSSPQTAAPTAEIQQPNAHGVYYFPQEAPKNERGNTNLSADWYQIEYAAQTADLFILQVGSDVSLDGRVARFGIDTDGNGKADKIVYRSLDHQLKVPLSNGETVVHAGFGVKADTGFTYLASVSKASGDIQYPVVSQN